MKPRREYRAWLASLQWLALTLLLLLAALAPPEPDPPRGSFPQRYATAEEEERYERDRLRDLLEVRREANATSRPG